VVNRGTARMRRHVSAPATSVGYDVVKAEQIVSLGECRSSRSGDRQSDHQTATSGAGCLGIARLLHRIGFAHPAIEASSPELAPRWRHNGLRRFDHPGDFLRVSRPMASLRISSSVTPIPIRSRGGRVSVESWTFRIRRRTTNVSHASRCGDAMPDQSRRERMQLRKPGLSG
jgi:hypothetical protein